MDLLTSISTVPQAAEGQAQANGPPAPANQQEPPPPEPFGAPLSLHHRTPLLCMF